jgi:hypothetical protein
MSSSAGPRAGLAVAFATGLGWARDHRSFGGVAARCTAVPSLMAMIRSPWVLRICRARRRRWRWTRSNGSTRRQAAVAHSPTRCGHVLADLLAEQPAVSAFPLGSATWSGGLVTHLAPAPAATDDVGRRWGGCPTDSDLLAKRRGLRRPARETPGGSRLLRACTRHSGSPGETPGRGLVRLARIFLKCKHARRQ